MSLLTILTLGVPLALFSWYMFQSLLQSETVERGDIEAGIRNMKKGYKENPESSRNLLTNRWMKFGGGFYGLTALYTFLMVEASDLIGFIMNYPGLEALLADGVINFLVNLFVGQIMNLVTAMIWFTWWGDNNQVIYNFAIAFIAYRLGMFVAEEDLLRLGNVRDT